MAAMSELTTDGLLMAIGLNLKRQRELRGEHKQLEEELERRYILTQDKYRRGEIEIKQEGVITDGDTATEG
jgi:hypothetical protein